MTTTATDTRCINLTFHGVGPHTRPLEPGEEKVWIDTSLFTRVLDAVADRRDVRISFDDGNSSDVEVALPLLSERGLSATFFVLAGRIGQDGFLSESDVHRLVGAGMTVGNHGMHHRDWRRLKAGEVVEELDAARRRLQEVSGQPVTQAAIPFGRYDRGVLRALRTRGYAHAFTSDGGAARSHEWLQSRTSLQRTDGPAEVQRILSPVESPVTTAIRNGKRAVKRWR